jgi:hypothetical protein
MNVPDRIPVWESWRWDPIRAQWLIVLILIDALYGGDHLPGDGLASWCGLALLLTAAMIGWGWNVAGAGLATVAWSAFMFAGHDSTILLGGIGAFHILVIYEVGTGLDADRQAKQQL